MSRVDTCNPSLGRLLSILFLGLCLVWFPSIKVIASPQIDDEIPTATEVINAVNALRANRGLSSLAVHTVLMQIAQTEADGIANGMPGHWRPDGMTLGQWLMSLGYPLAGDLSADGYRSENWVALPSAAEAIEAWLGDDAHSNTMLSPDRSDIGVGIAVSDDQVYIVLITALQTRDGKMQDDGLVILTQAATSVNGAAEGTAISQYVNPVVLSTAQSNGDVIHKILYGQSLWSIAIAYQTTIDQICAWNNLGDDTTVYEGQFLLVQRSATQPPTATLTPLVSTTPLVTSTLRQIKPSVTATVSPSATGVENGNSQKSSWGFKEWLFLVLVGVGGVITGWFIRKKN